MWHQSLLRVYKPTAESQPPPPIPGELFTGRHTLYGRFVHNGVMCACHRSGPKTGVSRLLDLLQLDPTTLIRFCAGHQMIFSFPTCLSDYTSDFQRVLPCPELEQYIARGGCRHWDWAALESGFFHSEWTELKSAAAMALRRLFFSWFWQLRCLHPSVRGSMSARPRANRGPRHHTAAS